jgi:diguanylate cyclase (GGDEF)-like protein
VEVIRLKFLIVVFFCGLFSSYAAAEDSPRLDIHAHKSKVMTLDKNLLSQDVGLYLDYVEDSEGWLKINILLNQPDIPWLENKKQTPNFGYSSSTYWFRLSLQNKLPNAETRFLVIDYPLLDQIEFYGVKNGTVVEHYLTGDTVPFSQRPIAHRSFVFPINLEANEQFEIYLKVQSNGAVQVPVTLWEKQAFFLADQAELIRKSVFYGVLLVMMLFNLFLFFSLREAPYIYYVMFVFSFLLTQTAMHGVLFQYLWPSFPAVQEMAVLIGVPGCVLFTSLFSRSFLSLAHYAPRMDLFFKVTALLGFVNIIAAFVFPYRIVTTSAVLMVAVVSMGCIFIGPYLWMNGHKIARFFTIAWMCMVFSTTILALSKFGLIPYNFFTENGLQFGASLEAVLLSFALADRLNRERKDRWRAQQKMLAEVRQRHHIEETMIYDATHNHLTGLPNRTFLENRFNELLKGGLFESEGISLVLVHFDLFHEINKTLGHLRADRLLNTICLKINNKVQHLDGLIEIEQGERQLYGVAVVEGVSVALLIDRRKNDNIFQSAKEIVKALVSPIEYDGLAIDAGAAVGIAHYPQHSDDIDTLLSHAMIAIDVGLHQGDRVTEYSDDINPYNARRLTLMGDLRKAVTEDTLELYFQPQVCCKKNKVTAVEALLRWNHSQHGFIPPDEFIPIAEKTGTINMVTEWVLDKAVEKVAELNSRGYVIAVAVNISAVNLKEKHFPVMVKSVLTKYGVNPQLLVLEVTETAMMEDPENALLILTTLNHIGVKLSIDDFGTGHSSLSYIKKLPVHEIKIDRSFVMDMDQAEDDSIIVRTTVNMCHDLGYEVVAEGVETLSSCESLKVMGCDYLQGYYLARPQPFDELLVWLDESPWGTNMNRNGYEKIEK